MASNNGLISSLAKGLRWNGGSRLQAAPQSLASPAAYEEFERDLHAAVSLALEAKSAPFRWDANTPQFNWKNVSWDSFAREGFSRNAVCYAAIMYKVRQLAQAPLRAYEGDIDNPELVDAKDPLSMLVARPNPYMSRTEFMAYNVVYLNTMGNSIIYLDRMRPDQLPDAMYPLNPMQVQILYGKAANGTSEIKGYKYIPKGATEQEAVKMLPFQIVHTKLPDPLDDRDGMGWGLSPFMSMALSGDVDNAVTRFLKVLFDNGTLVGSSLSFKDRLDDDVVDAIKTRWKELYGGSTKWATEIAILDSGAEYKRLTPTFDELGFAGIDERNESRMGMPFGVPLILLGSRLGLMRSTYSNYEQARRAFWEDTFTFELLSFEDELAYSLAIDGKFVKFDTSKVPALQVNVAPMVDSAFKLWTMGVPARVAFDAVGLEIPDYPGIDVGFLRMGYNLMQDVLNPSPAADAPLPPPPNGQGVPNDGIDTMPDAEDNPNIDTGDKSKKA